MNWDGIIGGVIGAGLTQFATGFREKRKERSARSYLVARITIQLEGFAAACLRVAQDWGEPDHGNDGEENWTAIAKLPTLSLESQPVDWSVIEHLTLRDVLRLPAAVAAAESAVADMIAIHEPDPPHHEFYFYTRQVEYAKLGIEACRLADALRALLHRSSNSPGDSDPRVALEAALAHTEAKWLQRNDQRFLPLDVDLD